MTSAQIKTLQKNKLCEMGIMTHPQAEHVAVAGVVQRDPLMYVQRQSHFYSK